MRRVAGWIVAAWLAAAVPALTAQEGAPARRPAESEGEAPEGGGIAIWKWVNFALLAGGLGYVIAKNAGPFFANRSLEIRKGMIEADEARAEADARMAAVEAKLANLQAEIEALRREAHAEGTEETERLRRETAAELAKIEEHAAQEIASLGKAARLELKRYGAQVAIALAEQKIQARMNRESQELLVRRFLGDLPGPASSAQSS
ncbi:MAG TPA: hypothetical protein VFA33_04230 [Bryobacteraceae bacterium]|nr:hypothetical protein [Bryobacteraceae bacterium]